MDDHRVAREVVRDPSLGQLQLPAAAPDAAAVPAGRSAVYLDGRAAGLLYVPRTPPDRLVVVLHGAGGTAAQGLGLLLGIADQRRLMLYAPQSLGRTWDLIESGYGSDVVRVQAALSQILPAYRVARPMMTIAGFSDGASYALSLGLINGDVFDRIVAFSPGFAAPTVRAGLPSIFVSHGRADRVLPIDRCSRTVVARLERAGYPLRYHEFDGGHEVPPYVVDEAMAWLSSQEPDRTDAAR